MWRKIHSIWRREGLRAVLSAAGWSLIDPVLRRRARLIWEARFKPPPPANEWGRDERVLVLGPDNIDREMTPVLESFLGDGVANSIAGVRAGDWLFVVANETEYLTRSFIFFDNTETTRKHALIYGEWDVPIIGMSY